MKNKVIYTLTILIPMVMLLPTVTYAILLDTETSTGNTFTAATLDTQISSPEQLVLDIANTSTSQQTIQFSLQNIGQLQTSNNIYIESVSNFSASDQIKVELKVNDKTKYTGALTKLEVLGYLNQDPKQEDNIVITLTVPGGALTGTTGDILEFTIVNKSYQLDGNPNSGFFDKESKKIKIINSTN